LAGELFKITTATDLQHIPFSGAGPAVSAVLAGQVQTSFASLPAVLPHVNAGSLRALAITSTVRSPAAPDIPTFAEAGFPAVESDHLQGLLAPAGTPKAIVDKLSKEVAEIIQIPEIRKQLVDLGFVLVGDTPEQFADIIKFQVGKWRKVITEANIKVD
jgi:tripartite-type tricarboxylate transporter receptor subunit TctC